MLWAGLGRMVTSSLVWREEDLVGWRGYEGGDSRASAKARLGGTYSRRASSSRREVAGLLVFGEDELP